MTYLICFMSWLDEKTIDVNIRKEFMEFGCRKLDCILNGA